ncbi:MAG: hypothetical protein ACRELY_31535 [Polyangiaceae bacterium]
MPYRIPGNDDELDARLDDELAQLDESELPRPADWRERRRSPYRLAFAAASIGGGIAMLSGQSVMVIAFAVLGGTMVGALFPFLAGLLERDVERERDDDEAA